MSDSRTNNDNRGVSDADRQVAMRFVDGELSAEDLQRFEDRMAAEAGLAAVVDDYRTLSSTFVSAPAPQPSAGFFDRVVREARREVVEPGDVRQDDGQQAAAQPVLSFQAFETTCRRLIVAAVLLFGLGLLVWGGILRNADSGRLEASAPELRAEMQRLDGLLLESQDGR